jgi:hypothetical protein
MPIETLEELLLEEIKDLYDAEKQITRALSKLAKAATNADLKAAFTEHLEQTKGQVTRLEEIFGDPILSTLGGGIADANAAPVVHHVAGDDQADRWNVLRRRIGAVGAALLDAQFVTLKRTCRVHRTSVEPTRLPLAQERAGRPTAPWGEKDISAVQQ